MSTPASALLNGPSRKARSTTGCSNGRIARKSLAVRRWMVVRIMVTARTAWRFSRRDASSPVSKPSRRDQRPM
jgi:hypothetical protein